MRDRRPTPAQLRVLKLISLGHTDDQAARILGISPKTAKTHSHSCLRRMEARSRSHAVAIAYELGLLP